LDRVNVPFPRHDGPAASETRYKKSVCFPVLDLGEGLGFGD